MSNDPALLEKGKIDMASSKRGTVSSITLQVFVLLVLSLSGTGCTTAVPDESAWLDALPSRPPVYSVYDPGHLLQSPQTQSALERLFVEHDRLTGEQLVLGIFPTKPKETSLKEDEALVEKIHRRWKVGQRGKDNGVLLAVFPNHRFAKITTGVGLASILSEEITQSTSIAHAGDRALPSQIIVKVTQTLEGLNSPLIQNGEIAKVVALSTGRSEIPSAWSFYAFWIPSLLIGIGFAVLIWTQARFREQVVTRTGWTPLPFSLTLKLFGVRIRAYFRRSSS
jgi:hypothetical protein